MTFGEPREAVAQHTFRAPFRMAGYDEVFPAGTYSVITREAAHEGNALTVYVRTATVLKVSTPRMTRYCEIDPAALEAALARDMRAIYPEEIAR